MKQIKGRASHQLGAICEGPQMHRAQLVHGWGRDHKQIQNIRQ